MADSRRPLLLIAGAGVALAAAIGAAAMIGLRHGGAPTATLDPTTPVPARRLTLEVAQDARGDIGKPLRCFVDGKFVGLETVADCARRNGVDPKSLDVGLDQSGQMAAGEALKLEPPPGAALDRAPSPVVAALTPPGPPALHLDAPPTPEGGGGEGGLGDCLRYAQGWRPAGRGLPRDQCVRILFDGRCVRPGQALYGRWGGETVRVVPGRVEVSDDNQSFRPLVGQDPADCTLPPA